MKVGLNKEVMNTLETIHMSSVDSETRRTQGCLSTFDAHKKIVNSLANFEADPVKSGFVITLQKYSNYETARKAARTGA